MTLTDKILSIDRRWIFLMVAFSVIIPLLSPIRIPVNSTKPVQNLFEKINDLPEGSAVLISCDFSPGSAPELSPMAYALMRHCFAKKHKVIVMTLAAEGAALAGNIVSNVVNEIKHESSDTETRTEIVKGKDYVYLGFKAGVALVIINLVENFTKTFPMDYDGDPINNQPIFNKIANLNDIDIVISLASSATPELWIAYGKEKCDFDMAIGCTAVSATQYYPYMNTGQIIGLMGGLKGAAEYERLIVDKGHYHKAGLATKGMSAQSIVHLMVVLMVIFTNTIYLINRRSTKK